MTRYVVSVLFGLMVLALGAKAGEKPAGLGAAVQRGLAIRP